MATDPPWSRAAAPPHAAGKGAVALVIRSIGTDSRPTAAHRHAALCRGLDQDPGGGAVQSRRRPAVEHAPPRPAGDRCGWTSTPADTGATKTEYNVIGEIRGRSLPDEVVVIGGHLDSWDLGTGAIDDGAGVAITMAAGAMIGRLDKAPLRTHPGHRLRQRGAGPVRRPRLRRNAQGRTRPAATRRGKRFRRGPHLCVPRRRGPRSACR